jgi:GxxExxY protein
LVAAVVLMTALGSLGGGWDDRVMHHEDTKTTKLHDVNGSTEDPYHSEEAKKRADNLSEQVIGAAIEVHSALGPGLLESAYEASLSMELALRGVHCRRQVLLPLNYKGAPLDVFYRVDILVEDLVILELKSVDKLEAIHDSQLLTYLRLSNRWLGLLINFNTDLVKHGLRRLLNR